MKYYKVLRVLKNGSRVSGGNIPDYLRQAYYLDKPTISKIKGGKLFVFEGLQAAFNYLGLHSHRCDYKYELWEVKVENPYLVEGKIPRVWLPACSGNISNYLRKWWKDKVIIEIGLGSPTNNVWATDSVRLIKKIR